MPITPSTLPDLYFSSKYIVIAKIYNPEVKIGKNISYDSCYGAIMTGNDGDGIAYLNIVEVLKGVISESQIVVSVEGFSCPAPAEYTNGKYVIAFLNKEEKEEVYITTSLAWGAKEDDNLDNRINSYKLGVYQLNRISKLTQNNLFNKYFLEFLVQCCENKDLKWDGIYTMINRKENSFNRYDYEFSRFVNLNITAIQKKRLEQTFLNSEILTVADLNFLFIISKKNRFRAANKIIKTISELDSEDYDLDKFMEGFLYLIPNKKLAELYDDYDYDATTKRKQEFVKEFVNCANAVLFEIRKNSQIKN